MPDAPDLPAGQLPGPADSRLRPAHKVALVAGGYVFAVLMAWGTVSVYIALTEVAHRESSQGMSAFGDSVLFLGVLAVAALPPTAGALYFLRPYPAFWRLLASVALVLAATGVCAGVLYVTGRGAPQGSPLSHWAMYSVLRLMVAPLLAMACFLAALFAPLRRTRNALVGAGAMEGAAFACLAGSWLYSFVTH